ncbi:MAG: MFS transporter [Verrucomicrobia bacterium]|nr:MFS transporter [Verrucomicrobiota bacterium]
MSKVDPKILKSRRASLYDALGASIMSGAGDAYIIPFAVALRASAAQIGFLSSFIGLIGAFSHIAGAELVYRFRRRVLASASAFAQCLLWVGLTALAFTAGKQAGGQFVYVLMSIYLLVALVGALGGPAWFSMMGEMVGEDERGDFFSRRNRIISLVVMGATLTGALVLDAGRSRNMELLAFAALFLAAAVGRSVSSLFLSRYYDPPAHQTREHYFSFRQFIVRAPGNNFGRFAIYVGLINLATHFSAPFFSVYMLRDLQFSYLSLSLVNLSGGVFAILSMRIWGAIGDKHGNRTLLRIGSMIIPFPPICWLFSHHPLQLIFSSQLLAGIGWAAFNLAAWNFIYDSVTPERRAICVAYYTVVNGICIFLGASLGGLFAQHIHLPFMNTFLLIFLISGALRMLISVVFLPCIREVRPVQPLRPGVEMVKLLYVLAPRPLFGMFRGVRVLLFSRLWSSKNKSPDGD